MRHLPILILFLLTLIPGCAQSYTTPGPRADFAKLGLTKESVAALTDFTIQQTLSKKPLVTFPADLAVVRVQASDYNSFTYSPYYHATPLGGAFSVITLRDVEKDDDFEALLKLPGIEGVAGIKRILLENSLNSDLELRNAAAKLNANLLLYYTFDTAFTNKSHVEPLGIITLGLAPNKEARVTCTVSAVLMDTRNAYIYGVYESTAEDNQLANAWTSADALDQCRRRTERKAFEGLLASFTREWPTVTKRYDKR